MKGVADETVGPEFRPKLLQRARDLALEVIREVAAQIRPGVSELEAKEILGRVQTAKGAPKSWHPPQIRFGRNTLLAFGAKGQSNAVLGERDIYFLDIGPIFDGHEGDVGRAFAVGEDAEMARCCRDVEVIWHEVQDHWRAHAATGAELYAFAEAAARRRGWQLCREQANGHRIADFPHAARARGSIEGFAAHPQADRWILEIQIRHPEREFGAFYEDLLR